MLSRVSFVEQGIQKDAYRRYLQYERKGWRAAFIFGPELRRCSTPESVSELIIENFFILDRFFLSLTQSRRIRAGCASEVLIREFFRFLDYPFTSQPRIDGNPDFVLPSMEAYETDPLNTIIFTVKRSLRERWRQIVTEGAKGRGFFLGTIDRTVSAVDVRAMQRQKIFVVVPVDLKNEIPHYQRHQR